MAKISMNQPRSQGSIFLLMAMLSPTSGLQVSSSTLEIEFQSATITRSFFSIVIELLRIMGTLRLQSGKLPAECFSQIPQKCRIHPSTYVSSPPYYSRVSPVFMMVFQNCKSGFSSKVSRKFSRITCICSMQVFNLPSTSYYRKDLSLGIILAQSCLTPAMQTFLMPQPARNRWQSKQLLKEFMTKAVEMNLYCLFVVLKSHQNFYTTPLTVFFFMREIISSKNLSQRFSGSSLADLGLTLSTTTSSILPRKLTNFFLRACALLSTYLVTQKSIIIQTSSGTRATLPCCIYACRKAVKKALDFMSPFSGTMRCCPMPLSVQNSLLFSSSTHWQGLFRFQQSWSTVQAAVGIWGRGSSSWILMALYLSLAVQVVFTFYYFCIWAGIQIIIRLIGGISVFPELLIKTDGLQGQLRQAMQVQSLGSINLLNYLCRQILTNQSLCPSPTFIIPNLILKH